MVTRDSGFYLYCLFQYSFSWPLLLHSYIAVAFFPVLNSLSASVSLSSLIHLHTALFIFLKDGSCHLCPLKNPSFCPGQVARLVEVSFVHQKVSVLIPGQGWTGGSWSMFIVLMSLSLSPSLFLSPSFISVFKKNLSCLRTAYSM